MWPITTLKHKTEKYSTHATFPWNHTLQSYGITSTAGEKSVIHPQHNRPDSSLRYFVLDLWLLTPRRKTCTLRVPTFHAVHSKKQSGCLHTQISSDSKYVNVYTYIYIYTCVYTHVMEYSLWYRILIVVRSHRHDQKIKSANGYVRYLHVSRYCSLIFAHMGYTACKFNEIIVLRCLWRAIMCNNESVPGVCEKNFVCIELLIFKSNFLLTFH